jgi:hypothetical protein
MYADQANAAAIATHAQFHRHAPMPKKFKQLI